MTRIKKIAVLSVLALAFVSALEIASAVNAQGPQRVPTSTTVPTIPAVSAGVIYGCTPFVAVPGSVTIGASGFVRIRCPSGGAVTLGTTAGISLTPSLLLTPGYVNASIILSQSAGNPCNDRFSHFTVGNVTVTSGALLNGTALSFSSSPQPGQLLASAYDYCLAYSGVTAQLNGFTVTWT